MPVYEQNSKELLFSSLYRLLQLKSIDAISVDEIIKGARVSRSTFYRNFRDKYELLQWANERIILMTFSVLPDDLDYRQTCLETLRMYERHRAFYHNGIRSDDPNALGRAMGDVNRAYFEQRLRGAGYSPEGAVEHMAATVYLEGVRSLVTEWISSGMHTSKESLADAICGALPLLFSRCLDAPSPDSAPAGQQVNTTTERHNR